MKKRIRKHRTRLTRREFIRYTAGASLLLGASPLLRRPGNAKAARPQTPHLESRTYLFNLSHMDTSAHDIILVAGTQRVKLKRVTSAVRRKARQDHPILQYVPDEHLTHHLTLDMPAEAIQLCYLQRVARGKKDGRWDMALLFYHLPVSALRHARQRGLLQAESGLPKVHVKWQRYGITPETLTALNDPEGEAMLQGTDDQAITLVAGHPEVVSLEPTSAAHIQTNIIATQPTTQDLGDALTFQGPATTTGGWATLTPLIDPDTEQPFLNSLGQPQYIPVWSDETAQKAGSAINQALPTVKNDPTLGTNITTLDPTTIITNDPDPDAPTNGVIWTVHDGQPTVEQSATAQALQTESVSYTTRNRSPGHGYSVTVTTVDVNRNVTIQVKNWYVRYLSLYIRYLDANDQPLTVESVTTEVQDSFPLWDVGQNGDLDIFANLVSPEFVVLGIPVSTTTIEFTFPLPKEATSALILAGGLGSGSISWPDTVTPGKVMTIVFDLVLPTIFLALAAAPAFATLSAQIKNEVLPVLKIVLPLFADDFAAAAYDADPKIFVNLAISFGTILLSKAGGQLAAMIAAAIAEGETEDAVTNAVPVVGSILFAIAALPIVAQITQTIGELGNSPNTYVDEITFTHTITVTIHPDPLDPSGFPAVTASGFYTVTAIFDAGTPQTLTQQLPAITLSAPQTVTFPGVPFGGRVSVSAGFFSPDGWLAGQGAIGPVDNTSGTCTTLTTDGSLSCNTSTAAGDLSLEFAITENKVPLQIDTTYQHQEVIVLDTEGNHGWQATSTPPAVVTPEGQCESVAGQICQWTGITVSNTYAAVGYSWQAYSPGVTDCVSGGVSQLYQFANLSTTQDPQNGALVPGCGFSGPVRLVYDLMGTQDQNFYLDTSSVDTSSGKNLLLLRQIQLNGTTVHFDGPTSNRAWGRLNLASDALLLHPIGKIISVNSELSKIEVLDLPEAAVPDTEAPLAQAYSGPGIREGLVDGPTLAALAPDGTILILETGNNRIQAFDLSANPVPHFQAGNYHVPLIDQPTAYLDMAVEYTGYIYVLSYTGELGALVYRLDIYTPEGDWLARTTGVTAAKLAVNYWRDVFTLNYQVLTLPDGSFPSVTEPSVSHWLPSTP